MLKGQDVCAVADIMPGDVKCVFLGETRILLANVDGKFYATRNVSSHPFAYLSEGVLDGSVVARPPHGAQFDVASGKALPPLAEKDIKTYHVTVVEGSVIVSRA
jgi:3-phenylpropionate/trans-cinnamate dioxygenase ferredoxin component